MEVGASERERRSTPVGLLPKPTDYNEGREGNAVSGTDETRPKPLVATITTSPTPPEVAREIEAAYADMIYHYTSAKAAFDIATGRKLWLTNVKFVNDVLEFRQPIGRLKKMIEHRNTMMRWAASEPEKYFDTLEEHFKNDSAAYVACFSKRGESLSQFRLYGQGAGYSLGLQRTHIQLLASSISSGRLPSQAGAGIVDCNYSEQDLYRWCDSYARDFFKAARTFDDGKMGPRELWQEISAKTDLLDQRLMAQMTFKSHQFNVEQEVRFYKFGVAGEERWRISRGGNYVVPYLEVDIANEPYRSQITPGPNLDMELAKATCSEIIKAAKKHGTVWQIGLSGPADSGFRVGL